jgi:hypothetical protein
LFIFEKCLTASRFCVTIGATLKLGRFRSLADYCSLEKAHAPIPARLRLPRVCVSRAFASPARLRLPRVCVSRAFASLALTLLSFLTLAPAQAGSYIGPVYTGGIYTAPNPQGVQTPYPYALTGTNYGGASGGAGPPSCTGTITTTFTWQPAAGQTIISDPPPATVIVSESCTVSVTTNYPGSMGAYNTGLGQSGSVSFTPGGNNNSVTVTGIRYTTTAGIPTITLKETPSATATTIGADSSLSYTAAATPVILTLSGTTKDSNGDNILIGQGCTGTVSAAPFTLSNYVWAVPGLVFKDFVVAPDQSSAQANPVSPSAWSTPSPLWHWIRDETVTVSAQADASINGIFVGRVSAQKLVKIWAPYYAFKNMAGPVSVDNRDGTLELYAGGPHTGTLGSGGWDPPGMKNGGRVGTPDMFRAPGVGLWQFVQIAHPGRWYYTMDGGTSSMISFRYDGHTGLDNFYPYPALSGSYIPPYPANSADLPTTGPAIPTYWMEDSPGSTLNDYYYRYRVDESFDDFMMYEPPDAGQGSEWVPLHLFQWKWQADISQIGTSWLIDWTPSPPGYVSNLSSVRWTSHPFWQEKLTN